MSRFNNLKTVIQDCEAELAEYVMKAKTTIAHLKVMLGNVSEPTPEPVSTRSRPIPTTTKEAINGGYCKEVDGRYVCLNCKQGGGPRVGSKGYANYGAWYNHCYGHRNGYETNCCFDA